MDLTDRLAAERRGRLAAERLLELKSRELFEANRKLSAHALSLTDRIVAQRDETEKLRERTQEVTQELQRAEQHAEVVERRLWDSVETITDGFAVFDAQDRLIAANTAWLSLWGFSPQIGPGTLYLEVLRLACEEGHVDLQGEEPGAWVGRMLERWDAARPEEASVRLSSGAWYRLIDRRSRDGDMVCLAQDVTALKERAAELEQARHRAEAANRAKSAFLANMSHELRTPMNGMVGMAEMALETELDDEQRTYLNTIKSSGDALLQIINHVLDFSKMEAHRVTLRPEPFDLERLLHEVLTLLSPSARDKDVALHVDYDLFLPTRLVGDPGRIRQILTNIVGNAVKFTAQGHVLVRVVGLPLDGEWQLHITVEDTGIGIPEDMREHIFGSFAQVESERNRRFEGTGLGLAITRELVELMGGEIWVESEEGKGSCFGFHVRLPDAEPGRVLPGSDVGDARALIVGRDGMESDILRRQLAQLGIAVEQVETGSAALARATTVPRPQIVLADEILPDTSAPALGEALAAAGCEAARVMICASAHDAARAGPDALRSVHAVLARPLLRSQLFEALVSLPDRALAPAETPGGKADVAGVTDTAWADTAEAEAPPARPAGAPRRMRVLAAEDNKTNRFVLAKMLRNLDIDLHFAEDGARAVELFAEIAPDLIFMDISMPGMDGREASRVIREMEEKATQGGAPGHVPIVAMTAHAMDDDREDILAGGIDHYLTKPLKRALLEQKVIETCPDTCLRPDAAAAQAG